MGAAADPAERDDTLSADKTDPLGDGDPAAEAPDAGHLFVGRTPEIAQAVATLAAGGSTVVRGRAGIGKRALMREVRRRIAAAGTQVCLWPSIAIAKQIAADLAE
jgi:MoxR-like ATPase